MKLSDLQVNSYSAQMYFKKKSEENQTVKSYTNSPLLDETALFKVVTALPRPEVRVHGRGLLEGSCDTHPAPASCSSDRSLPQCARERRQTLCVWAAWQSGSPSHQPTLRQLRAPPASSTERKICRMPAWFNRLFPLTFLQRQPRQAPRSWARGEPRHSFCDGTSSAASRGEQRQEQEIGHGEKAEMRER